MLRFAPSPIVDMHIDNLRIAILTYIVSQQRGEQFLIRIEDGNKEKNIEGKDTEIMMILEKFAIKHDSLYHQSQHLGIHQNLAIRLLQEKKAFICREEDKLTFDDYSSIKESGEPFVICLKSSEQDSFIIMQSDNRPTDNFASACDDMLSNISFVIRKEEYLNDTAKQIYIKSALGYKQETKYLHLPTIKGGESYSVKYLFQEGFLPDAILNYLVLIGYREAPKEIFTLPEAIEWFELENISNSSVQFDIDKLRFINREHLKLMDDKQLSTLFGFADIDIGKLAKLYLKECSTINELEAKIRPIFKPKNFDGEFGEQMRIIEHLIAKAPAFETFNELKKYITKESGLKGNNLFKPLQILLTGAENSPKLSEIYPLIKSYILEVAS